MIHRKPAVCILGALLTTCATTRSQEIKEKQEPSAAHSRDGKNLFGTAEALRVARELSPRISPDGSRIAYLVAENKMEKDKPWKSAERKRAPRAAPPPSRTNSFRPGC